MSDADIDPQDLRSLPTERLRAIAAAPGALTIARDIASAILLERDATTDADPLALARQYDPDARWVSNAWDENCMLVAPAAVAPLLDAFASLDSYGAYEDPNAPGATAHTRVVFPLYRTTGS